MAVGRATPHARSDSTGAPAICSASLLTADRGRADAADAVRRMSADGFPDGSTVFLNVELVAAVTPALAAYVRAWLANVLSGGRYRPGVYAVKKNAESLHDIAVDVYRAAGRADRAPFWISSGGPFALTSAPADVGVSYADIWQGMFGVAQQYNGVRLIVDVNVANRSSPGAP
jgi:hypothetical protein